MFLRRLARENRWTENYARRVVDEYKRFMFLAVAAGHPVTPSEDVDEAWHLHLIYTRSYWDEFCGQVLTKAIHHDPTKGGPSELRKHREQYERTLASYREWFGMLPPVDIWPTGGERFSAASPVRVNRERAWIVPKPWTWTRRFKPSSQVAVAAAAPLVLGVLNPLELKGPEFLAFYFVVALVAVVLAAVARAMLRSDEQVADEPLTADEVACLSRGPAGAIRAALVTLVADDRLRVEQEPPKSWFGRTNYRLVGAADSKAEGPVQEVLVDAAGVEGNEPRAVLVAARPAAEAIERDLAGRGLLETNESFYAARWAPLAMLATVWLLGAAKLMIGLSRGRPVGILVVALIVLFVVMMLFYIKPRRTRAGNALLRRLEVENSALKSIDWEESPEVSPQQLALAASLFGFVALTHPSIDPLKKAIATSPEYAGGGFSTTSTWSGGADCGGGGGCGGGGCGGGGCGGCGG
jgi:uncharacterized protein (TIGR04222 family)